MLAIDSAGVWAGRGSTSLTTAQTLVRVRYCADSGPSSLLRRLWSEFATAQTLVPNKRNMAVPYWDDGGFTFLQ